MRDRCRNGHLRTPENTTVQVNGRTNCLECKRARANERNAAARANATNDCKCGCGQKVVGAYARNHHSKKAPGAAPAPRVYDRVRFWSNVDKSGECWTWTGPLNNRGYGRYSQRQAHRVVWEIEVGPIPDGLTIDHLCFNPPCVRPDHLRLLSHIENSRRQRKSKKWRESNETEEAA